jgi:hypothetical protein
LKKYYRAVKQTPLSKKFRDENYAAGAYDVQNVNLCVTGHKKSLLPVQEFIVLNFN